MTTLQNVLGPDLGTKCCIVLQICPTNPDLADILGKTDFDFENFHLFDFSDPKFLDFQVPRFPNYQIEARPGLGGLGPARALLRRGSAVAPGPQSAGDPRN